MMGTKIAIPKITLNIKDIPSAVLLIQLMTFSFIHSSMALQPFVGPWPFFQFRNFFYIDGRTPWTRDQPVARPLPTQRTTQTQNKRKTNIYAFE
jgi:hypothetical protein